MAPARSKPSLAEARPTRPTQDLLTTCPRVSQSTAKEVLTRPTCTAHLSSSSPRQRTRWRGSASPAPHASGVHARVVRGGWAWGLGVGAGRGGWAWGRLAAQHSSRDLDSHASSHASCRGDESRQHDAGLQELPLRCCLESSQQQLACAGSIARGTLARRARPLSPREQVQAWVLAWPLALARARGGAGERSHVITHLKLLDRPTPLRR